MQDELLSQTVASAVRGRESASPAPEAVRQRNAATGVVVWMAWAGMTVAALWLVWRYGSNVPSWDDWDMVPVLTGNQPVTLEWLWSQHNEHRVPIPRLLLLGLSAAFGIDFRVPMLANVLATAAVAAAAIVIAGRIRGRASVADAFFPLVLLNWGHAVNFVWGWQVQFFSSALLSGVAVLAIARSGPATRCAVGVAAACALALPLCGANGLGLVPALAVWLMVVALIWWRGGRRGAATAVALAAVAAGAITAIYFTGYEPVPYHPGGSTRTMLRTAPKFLTLGWGPVARPAWPWLGVLTALLGAAAVWWAGRAFLTRPAERVRAAGVLCFLGAVACLALGLGRGRDGFEMRYVALAVPGLMAVYLAAGLYASRRAALVVQSAMLAAAALSLWPNTRAGIGYAADLRRELGAFEAALAAGTPAHRLVPRFRESLHPHDDIVTEYLPMLARAGVHPYDALLDAPPLHELNVALSPVATEGLDWDPLTSTASVRGAFTHAHLDFALPRAVHAAGIRLRYLPLDPGAGAPYTVVSWTDDVDAPFDRARSRKISPTGDRHTWGPLVWTRIDEPAVTMTTWIDAPVAAVRIVPDLKPGRFRLLELTVLIEPPQESGRKISRSHDRRGHPQDP